MKEKYRGHTAQSIVSQGEPRRVRVWDDWRDRQRDKKNMIKSAKNPQKGAGEVHSGVEIGLIRRGEEETAERGQRDPLVPTESIQWDPLENWTAPRTTQNKLLCVRVGNGGDRRKTMWKKAQHKDSLLNQTQLSKPRTWRVGGGVRGVREPEKEGMREMRCGKKCCPNIARRNRLRYTHGYLRALDQG
jgi:hypothetical protein